MAGTTVQTPIALRVSTSFHVVYSQLWQLLISVHYVYLLLIL